jgi:hypothetical protein
MVPSLVAPASDGATVFPTIRDCTEAFATMPEVCPPPYEMSISSRPPVAVAHCQTQEDPLPNLDFNHGDHTSDYSDPSLNEKPSLALTQRLERKLAEYNASQNVFKRWLFEILSWAASALCMGAIVGIYIWLKDKPMSQVGGLLTYTNILGKVASAALIVPTSEALGQLKWNWFHDSKAVWDFEIFDKASRYEKSRALRRECMLTSVPIL